MNSMQRPSKKRVFEEASLLFQLAGVPHNDVFEALYARERLGNNALGGGVALPHCRIEGLKRPMAVVVILQRPIPIDPTPYDNKPVDLFFFLIVPETDNDDEFLPLLRECIAMLKDRDFAEKLRHTVNGVEVCSLILDWRAPKRIDSEMIEDKLDKEWDLLNEEVKAHHSEHDEDKSLVVAAVENES